MEKELTDIPVSKSRKKKPKVGEIYEDSQRHRLYVSNVVVGERLGREVQGQIKRRGDRKRYDYATTIEIWKHRWRDKTPPMPTHMMKIG